MPVITRSVYAQPATRPQQQDVEWVPTGVKRPTINANSAQQQAASAIAKSVHAQLAIRPQQQDAEWPPTKHFTISSKQLRR